MSGCVAGDTPNRVMNVSPEEWKTSHFSTAMSGQSATCDILQIMERVIAQLPVDARRRDLGSLQLVVGDNDGVA